MKNIKVMIKLMIVLILAIIAYYINDISSVTSKSARMEVKLGVCVDGDTARFILDGEEKKYRFLLIDTPESTYEIEPYGKEAANFTCESLKNADKIEIEYQMGNDKQDKYNRELVWVFVDGKLLQTEIAKAGYVKKLYDNNGPFDYKQEIIQADLEAQQAQVGIYSQIK